MTPSTASRPLLCQILLACALLAVTACAAETAEDPPANSAAEAGKTQHPANRLADESSPYLLQHAHNPVDWYPWGPEAFEKAKAENKPIFLSIGYSTCFWCHVMERKVFENADISAYMNEHFVNIKVDREERPDIDDIYMLALQVYLQAAGAPGGGGWPLSMFLTPEGKPIAGGTYFPPEDMGGRPGFLTVLTQLNSAWTNQQDRLQQTADLLAREVRRLSAPGLAVGDAELAAADVDAVVTDVVASFDAEHGGVDFSPDRPNAPKFPVPVKLELLQSRIGDDQEESRIETIVEKTLDEMAAGGIYDHLAGGFHRYSTDREWLVPHFEKMLYDNAQLADLYTDAWRRTRVPRYRTVAEETLDFVLREMTDPAGGFYSAFDAETDGVEGLYYVWSRDEITDILGPEDAETFSTVYGLNEPRVFEHGYVLHLPRELAESAKELNVPLSELRDEIDRMRAELLEARKERPPLRIDDKVLTAWNGLMIRALANAGKTFNRSDYTEAARKAALFLLSELRDEEGRLLRTWRNGVAKIPAYLVDYAFLVDGLLALYEATGDQQWLTAAQRLTDQQIKHFYDEAAGGFFFTSTGHESLLARPKNGYDSVMPSGNSAGVANLVKLAALTGQDDYLQRAEETLKVFAPRFEQSPGSLAAMAQGLAEYLQVAAPAPEDVPVAEAASADTGEEIELALNQQTQPGVAAEQKVAAKAYLSVNRLPAGKSARIAILVQVDEGWHINANPAQPDFLIPTELSLSAAEGFQLKDIRYPKGKEFELQGLDETLLVYEGQTLLFATLAVPKDAGGSAADLTFKVRYQACDDEKCLPPDNLSIKGRIPVAPEGEEVKQINEKIFARDKPDEE